MKIVGLTLFVLSLSGMTKKYMAPHCRCESADVLRVTEIDLISGDNWEFWSWRNWRYEGCVEYGFTH